MLLLEFPTKEKFKVKKSKIKGTIKLCENKNQRIFIITLFILLLIFRLIKIEKIKKKLIVENNLLKAKLNFKIKEPKEEEYKETFKIVTKYINQLTNESSNINSLINTYNYNFDIKTRIKVFINKLNYIFLKEEYNKTSKKNDSSFQNNNFTIIKKNDSSFHNSNFSIIKKNYHELIENVYSKYEKENDENKNQLKQYILNSYSSLFHRNITQIDTIVFLKHFNLGNALFTINNLIYFCEILNCKNIYLSKFYFFLKKPVYSHKYGIRISPYNEEDICGNKTTICITKEMKYHSIVKIFKVNFFIPIRNYIFKDEFLSNIKLIETKDDDLYINIRSGEDIFHNRGYSPTSYFQPPLCFYQTIIENFNFSNIYIISNGKENPVVEELLKLYENIKYIHGTIEEDASMVISAKNLVIPVSSFSLELIRFSKNLKNLFQFDFITDSDRRTWHFTDRHLRPFKFNKFVMYPNKEYVEMMFPWKQKKEQFERMKTEKCNKKFEIIPSDFI